ncbi:MAG: hypothetical protein SGILL_008041, partial [Bacillariaceae sp.]
EIPEEFICPLTLSIMNDPVVSKDGKNFDRQAILKWLAKGNDTCPLTRNPLRPSLLVPNHNLKMNIRKWMIDQGMNVEENTEKEDDGDCQCSICNDAPVPQHRNLMSLASFVDWSNETMGRIAQQPEERQEGDLADLLAMYEEVLAITGDGDDDDDADESSSDVEDDADLQAIVDHELRDIKELYEEVTATTVAQAVSQ